VCLEGHSSNISKGGIAIAVEALRRNYFESVLQRRRLVRVRPRFPEADQGTSFFGRTAWYRIREGNGQASCQLGIAFENLHEHERALLDAVLTRLARENGDSPASPS
jgi:hypothetical protein